MNDFALFLKSEFKQRQQKNPQFSLRSYSRWLGVSPAQISQIISGKRPVTLKAFKKMSAKLNLSPFEQRKFMLGLSPEQNETPPAVSKRNLAEDEFRLIADWYHLAILSLTRVKDAKSDSRWIAQQLGITVPQANEAVARLVRLGCLQIKPQFKQLGEPFTIVSEVPSAAIRKYHQQNLLLASEKIETVPVNKRQIQSISFPMNSKQLDKYKALIDSFLDDAVQISEKNKKDIQEIYHLNVQLFPVTKTNP